MIAQLDRLGVAYEIVEAVDGRAMGEEAFLNSTKTPGEFTPSQAGCALSHNKVYAKMQESADEFALVLEDDVLIEEENFRHLLVALENIADNNAITLLTYFWCREGSLELKAANTPIPLKGKKNKYSFCNPSEIHGIGRAAAYVLSKQCAKKILNFNTPLVCQADSWVVYYDEKVISNVNCIYPMPVTENVAFGSEIGYTKNGIEAAGKKLVEALVKWNIPVIAPAIKRRRQQYSLTYKNIYLTK
jgi:glycosyl transferase family 25